MTGPAVRRIDGCQDRASLTQDPAAASRPTAGPTPPPASTGPHAEARGEGVAYTVALPAGMKLLNSNDTFPHWRPRADLTKSIVDAAIVMTRKAKVPKLDRVIISAVYHPHDRRKRDAHNWSPSVKAAIDGIVRSGVLRDDDSEHVTDGGITLGEPVKGGQLVLHITPVGGAQ